MCVSTRNYGIRGESLDVKFNGGALIIPKDQLKTATFAALLAEDHSG